MEPESVRYFYFSALQARFIFCQATSSAHVLCLKADLNVYMLPNSDLVSYVSHLVILTCSRQERKLLVVQDMQRRLTGASLRVAKWPVRPACMSACQPQLYNLDHSRRSTTYK